MSTEAQGTPLIFRFRWDRGRHMRVSGAMFGQITALRLFSWLVLAFLGVAVLLTAVLTYFDGAGFAISVGPWLILTAFWLWFLRYGSPLLKARAHAKKVGEDFPIEMQVSEVGLRQSTPLGSTELRWAAFKRVVETPQYLFFFYNWQCAYYLPLEGIGESEQIAVRKIVEAGTGRAIQRGRGAASRRSD